MTVMSTESLKFGAQPREELDVLRGMMVGSQEKAREDGRLNEWSARQCFLALGFLLSAAAVRGIDACPMEGFLPEEYDKILGIGDDGYFFRCCMCARISKRRSRLVEQAWKGEVRTRRCLQTFLS